MPTKRITININQDVDTIRDKLAKDTGIRMSYVQIFNFLIHFYMTRAAEPKSQWASLKDFKGE